jgi:hypothetical protein
VVVDQGTSGNFLSGFLGLHGLYYNLQTPHNVAAGHIHVGFGLPVADASALIEATLHAVLQQHPPTASTVRERAPVQRPCGRGFSRYDPPMTYGRKLLIAALFVSSSCGGSGGGTAGQTDSASDSNGSSSSASSTSGGPGATLPTTSGDDGTVSDSMTSNPSSDTATGTTTTTDPTATTGPGDPTSASTTADDSATGTSTGAPDDTSTGGVIDTNSSTGDSSSTGPDCVPMPEVCNDLDDDCDDIVDDVDEGGDGICDCLNIALFGNKGSNPAAQFEAWLEAQGTQVDRIQTDNTPITQAILDKYDIIILDRLIRTYDPMEAALVAGWVGDGGGLMSMTGYTGAPPDVNNPNSIIGPMGLTYNNSKGSSADR